VITLPVSGVHPEQNEFALPNAPLGTSTAPAHSATHVSAITIAFTPQPGKLDTDTGAGAGAQSLTVNLTFIPLWQCVPTLQPKYTAGLSLDWNM